MSGRATRLLVFLAAGTAWACERTTVEPEPPPSGEIQSDTVSAMTFNIMHDAARSPEQGNIPPWEIRRDAVAGTIAYSDADIVGLQEAYLWQVEWLERQLPEYEHFGRGRDAEGADESVSILFRADDLSLEESGHFWLSPTPDEPGSVGRDGWGGMRIPRIVTWVRLELTGSGRQLYVYNTHLPSEDTGGAQARRRSVLVLADRIAARSKPEAPFLLLGDLNASENDFPLRYLKREVPACDGPCPDPQPFSPVAVFDTWNEVNSDDGGTRCRNDPAGERVPEASGERIDYVLANDLGDDEASPVFEVESSSVFAFGSSCASDHAPVLSRLLLLDP